MIDVRDATMIYPAPRRYRDCVLRPFHRNGRTALAGVSLTVPAGTCLGVLGANGAGKTTLLRLLGGLLYPTCGAVRVGGYDTVRQNAQVRRLVGYVLNEERSFYWRLTGRQNLRFFGALDDLAGAALDQRVDDILERVGLAQYGETRVSGYSSGMRQRLAVARGLLADPGVLILDEPTRSLDERGTREVHELLSEAVLATADRTVVLSTHDPDEAAERCNLVCVLTCARLTAIAPVAQILSEVGSLREWVNSARVPLAPAIAGVGDNTLERGPQRPRRRIP
ncbi:MAG: ABC transporter ATP-binding protein [Isosphaeraceae bacterium]|nr:ABC transporter ATP-binding protein [Isosphaeraceae bacterium]